LSSQAESEYGGAVVGQPLQTYRGDLNDVLKNVDFGICLGVGISFSIGNGYLFVEGRYSHGLVDLYQGGKIEWSAGDDSFVVEANEEAEMYNKGFQVMTGFTFPLGNTN
jgi:hypothetical protein